MAAAELAFAALVLSLVVPSPQRLWSTGLGVVAAATAWASLAIWQEWSLSTMTTATAILAAVVALMVSVALYRSSVDLAAAGMWGLLVPVGLAFSSLALLDASVPRWPAADAVALAFFATAAASLIAMRPTGRSWLRELGSGLAVIGGAALAYGSGATAPQLTISAAAVGLAATLFVAMPATRDRAGAWTRPAAIIAISGLGVTTAAGAAAGAGWLALALVVVASSVSLLALHLDHPARSGAVIVSVAAIAGAWASFATWQSWDLEQTATASALMAAGTAAVLGVLFRLPYVDQVWIALWSLLPTSVLLSTTLGLASPDIDRWPAGGAVALGYAAAAGAAMLAAGPTRRSWLRETAALLLVAAGATLAYATTANAAQIVAVSATVGLLATLSAAAIEAIEGGRLAFLRAWVRPTLILSAVGLGVSIGTALTQWPERPLLVASWLLLGVDMAALGLRGRWPTLLTMAPVPIGIAWLVFASDALTGDAQWFTLPMGVVLLVIVGLARYQRRRAGQDPVTRPIIAFDLIGSVLVVSSALVETVSTGTQYGLVAVGLGIAIAVWGVLTRVRRRLVFGAGTIALAVASMILVPLAGLVPQVGGPALWLALAVLGLTAILIAAFLEQGRATARRVLDSLHDLTRGWEGWTTHRPSPQATA